MPVSPARVAAFDILLRVEQQDAYASELLHSDRLDKLSPADRALATEIVMGVLRWRSRVDDAIAAQASRPLARLDPQVLTALRVAAYQLLYLNRVPAHAIFPILRGWSSVGSSISASPTPRLSAGMISAFPQRPFVSITRKSLASWRATASRSRPVHFLLLPGSSPTVTSRRPRRTAKAACSFRTKPRSSLRRWLGRVRASWIVAPRQGAKRQRSRHVTRRRKSSPLNFIPIAPSC